MGVAVGKKCPACGCGGVLSKFNKTIDRIQFDCSACDYRWTELPLFLQAEEPMQLTQRDIDDLRLYVGLLRKGETTFCGRKIHEWIADLCGRKERSLGKKLSERKAKDPLRKTWTLEKEAAHLEMLVKEFEKGDYTRDWRHVRHCFRRSAERLRVLVDRGLLGKELLDQLEAMLGKKPLSYSEYITFRHLRLDLSIELVTVSAPTVAEYLMTALRKHWG